MTYSNYPLTSISSVSHNDKVYYISMNPRVGVNPLTASIDEHLDVTLTANKPSKSGKDSVVLRKCHLPETDATEFLVKAENIDPEDIFHAELSGDYTLLQKKVSEAFNG